MLTLEAGPDAVSLDAAQDRIEAFLEGQGADGAVRYRVRLVVDELLANLRLHGRFAGPPPPARIEVRLEAGAALLAIEDAAEPFDPRTAPEPAGPPRLDEDRVGGLGLALVRRMAEIRDYRPLPGGWNRTELVIAASAG